MQKIKKSVMPLILMLLNVGIAEADAGGFKNILSIAEDNKFMYRFMIDDVVGLSFGYYESDRTYTNNLGQNYTRSFVSNSFAVRINANPDSTLRYFFQIERFSSEITYKKSTLNDSTSDITSYMYGMEYKLNEHFSVEGMVGFANRKTNISTDQPGETESITYNFGPTTALAVNYTF